MNKLYIATIYCHVNNCYSNRNLWDFLTGILKTGERTPWPKTNHLVLVLEMFLGKFSDTAPTHTAHSLLVPPEWSSSHVHKVSQLIHSAVRFESYFQMRVQLADRWDMQEESLVLGGLVSLKESHWAQVSHWRASQETNVRSTIKQELWASCSAGAFCLRTDLLSDICHITFA